MNPTIRIFFWLSIAGLSLTRAGLAADPLPVFVSIPPQKYFVQQIGQDLVEVRVMLAPGADPHTYEPKPQQMAHFSKAKIYFTIGLEFERAKLGKLLGVNPGIRVVATDQGISKIPTDHHGAEPAGHTAEGESHSPPSPDANHNGHPAEEHGHGRLDPHIWLAPPLVMTQARTILAALQEYDPAHHGAYAANFARFSAALAALDQDLKNLFAGQQGLRFMVLHPSWGYFAASYGLRQIPIELEGKTPKPRQLADLIERARRQQIRVIFAQPQFSARSAALVAQEIGGQVVLVDPLAENWMANLRQVAARFGEALR